MDVYLRAFEPGDYKLINLWRSTPGMYDLTKGNIVYISLEQDRRWVEEKIFGDKSKEIYWSIVLLESSEMIGYISLNNIDLRNRKAEWGALVIGNPANRKGGYAVQASILMLQYAFEEMNLHRVIGYWLDDNQPSLFLGLSVGFKREGVFREHVFKNGGYHDVIIMSLLESEFKTVREDLMKDM